LDGLCRVAGGLVDVTLGGREYLLRPMVLRDFATVEFHLLAASGTPLDAAARVLPILAGQPDARRRLIERAREAARTHRRFVRRTWEDVLNWIEKPDGVTYTGWLCLLAGRGRRPLATLGAARKLFAGASEAERLAFAQRRNLVSGLDDSAAADWPQPKAGGVAAPPALDERLLSGCTPAAAEKLRRQFAEHHRREADAERQTKERANRYSPWKKQVVELLRDAYGFDFETVAGLTLYQWRLARAGDGELGGVARMSMAEYQAWKARQGGG
jgi:hypothetical protein